jgi:hypothetical protein
MSDVQIKGKIVVDTGNAAPQVDNLKKKLGDAGAAGKGAQGSFSNLKKELGGMSEGFAMGGQSAGLLNNALNILRANPIVGVIVLLAGALVGLFQKFKQMEAVSDSLGKAWASLSTMFNTFTNAILTPLIDGFVKLVEWGTKAAEFVVGIFAPGLAKASQEAGRLAEQLDDLEDAEKQSAIARAESNRRLQEAREIAADANVPIKQRIAALKEAAKIEKEETEKSIQIAITKARIIAEQIAIELGARDTLIKKIREGSLESLKAARNELMQMKNVNKEQLEQIDNLIIQAEEQGASLAKISKKTNTQITSIEKEEQNKRVAAAKEAYQKKKELMEKERRDREEFEQQQRDDWEAAAQEEIRQDAERIADEERRQAEEEERRQTQYQRELAALGAKIDQEEQAKDQALQNEKVRADLRVQLVQQVMNGLGALADLVGRQTKLGKVLALAEIATGTAVGFIQGLDIAQKGAKSTGPAAPFAFPIFYATQIAAILGAVGRAKSALASSPGGGGGSFSVTAPKVDAPMNPVPVSTATTLDRDSINQIGNAARGGTNRAYVVSGDINSENERNARIERAARLG